MPEFRLVDKLEIKTDSCHSLQFPNKPLAGIQVRVIAQKDATAIVETNLKKLRVEFRGNDIVNCQYVNLRKWQDLHFGKPEKNEAGSGVESHFGVFVPFFHPELPSAIHKTVKDDMHFYLDKIDVADPATANVEVYAVIEDLPELYIPKLQDFLFTLPKDKITIDRSNIASIMITKPATTVPTLIQLEIDGKLKFSGNWNGLQNYSNNCARIEATALEVLLLDLVQKRQISDALSDDAILMMSGGSGAGYYMIQNLIFDQARTSISIDREVAKVRAKLQDKVSNDGAVIAVFQNPIVVDQKTIEEVKRKVRDPETRRKIEILQSKIITNY